MFKIAATSEMSEKLCIQPDISLPYAGINDNGT